MVGILAGLLVGCGQSESPFQSVGNETLAKARQLRERFDYEGALIEVDRFLRANPGHRGAQVLKAEVLLNLDRLDDADRLLGTMQIASAGDPVARALLGLVRKQQGRTKEALELLRSVPAKHVPRLQFAELLVDAGDWKTAAAEVSALLVDDPWHPSAYFMMSKIDGHRGRETHAEAWAALHRAHRLIRQRETLLRNRSASGDVANAQRRLAEALHESGAWYEALALLQQSARSDGTRPETFRLMAKILTELGQHAAARPCYARLAKLSPQDAEAAAHLAQELPSRPALEVAREHAKAGRTAQARATALFAAKQNMRDPDALRLVVELHSEPGDGFVRLWALRQAVRTAPRDPELPRLAAQTAAALAVPDPTTAGAR
ncbi:MAG: hypothetical protein KDC87_12325 [Planctomycetes bacterium]|nr:hypothetical protein [Planctomycetota bacterium]MCB9871005.1 hypothetical protein [Planctomycetota bacterium]